MRTKIISDERRRTSATRTRGTASAAASLLALAAALVLGVVLAHAPAAQAASVGPLVSVATHESAGTTVGNGTVLSVTFNRPPALLSSYSLTLTDGPDEGMLSSAAGTLSASTNGSSIDFTVHGAPAMIAGSRLSAAELEVVAETGVADAGDGEGWNLVASGQVDKPATTATVGTCTNLAVTRVFGGANCDIGFAHAGPTPPDVFDVIPVPTSDLPGPPDDNAPEVITNCQAGSTDLVFDLSSGAPLGANPCGANPPEQNIGNTNSSTLDYIATPHLVSFEEIGVEETIPGSNYLSATAVPPQLSGIVVAGAQATFSYYDDVVCQDSTNAGGLTASQFTYETPFTNLDRAGLIYATAVSCPPASGGTTVTISFADDVGLLGGARFKYEGYGAGYFIVGAPGSQFADEREASQSALISSELGATAQTPAPATPATPAPAASGTVVSAPAPAVAPGTRLLVRQIDSRTRSAVFRFRAVGAATRFQCALARGANARAGASRAGVYRACRSPMRLRGLTPGRYVLRVRAVGPGGLRGSPATDRFAIHAVVRSAAKHSRSSR